MSDSLLTIVYLVPIVVVPLAFAYLLGMGNVWAVASWHSTGREGEPLSAVVFGCMLVLWPLVVGVLAAAFAVWLPYRVAYRIGQRRRLPKAKTHSDEALP